MSEKKASGTELVRTADTVAEVCRLMASGDGAAVARAREMGLAAMNDAERKLYERERTRMDRSLRGNVQHYFQLGKDLKAVREGADNRYGSNLMQLLASLWGYDLSHCHKCVRVYNWFEGSEERALETRLSWGALTEIEAIEDPERRQGVLDQAAAGEWSLRRLRQELERRQATPRRSTPRGVSGILTNATEQAADLSKFLTNRFRDVFDLFETDAVALNPKTADLIHSSAESLRRAGEAALAKASELDLAEKKVRDRLAAPADAPKPAPRPASSATAGRPAKAAPADQPAAPAPAPAPAPQPAVGSQSTGQARRRRPAPTA